MESGGLSTQDLQDQAVGMGFSMRSISCCLLEVGVWRLVSLPSAEEEDEEDS